MVAEVKTRNLGILLFEGAELLDFAGPYEAFSTAGRREEQQYFNTFSLGEKPGSIVSANGLPCGVEYTLEDAPKLDILLVPGGKGTRTEVRNTRLIEWIKEIAASAELVTSVCTGSFLLAEAGLLKGKQATTHWASIERMRETYPDVEVLENVRYVDQGDIVTSAGVSAGIDMALYLIERLHGTSVAEGAARVMEYDYWTAARTPSAAD